MNYSFNRFHLVNTYGAFGSITKERYEIIIEGTAEKNVTPETVWKEYQFKGKPGTLARRPPLVAPYHLRLDWLMWFAAFSPNYAQSPEQSWFIPFVEKLLRNDPATLSLIKHNPFPDNPPQFIRAQLYLYQFTTPEEKQATGNWWKRELVGDYLPPASLR